MASTHLLSSSFAALVGVLLAWPAGAEASCAVVEGPEIAPGLPAVTARCHWPEVSPEALRGVLDDLGGYDEVFWMIDVDEVVAEQGERILVRQVHVAPVVQPRDALVAVWSETHPDGGFVVRWALHPEQPPPAPGHVLPARNDGTWRVHHDGVGGSRLTLDLAYDPAGSVPTWLVRWVQDEGARRALRQLRQAALAHEDRLAAAP